MDVERAKAGDKALVRRLELEPEVVPGRASTPAREPLGRKRPVNPYDELGHLRGNCAIGGVRRIRLDALHQRLETTPDPGNACPDGRLGVVPPARRIELAEHCVDILGDSLAVRGECRDQDAPVAV